MELNTNLFDSHQLNPVPSVKKLSTKCKASIRDLARLFPSHTELDFIPTTSEETELMDILEKGQWPNLKQLKCLQQLSNRKKLLTNRPNLYGDRVNECFAAFRKYCKIKDETLQFEKEWLILDEFEQDFNKTALIKFMKI